MLLVKSRESKNLNKKSPLSSVFAGLFPLFLYLTTTPVFAQNTETSPIVKTSEGFTSVGSFISIFLSLLLVIAIIFALAYVMRRFNVAQAGNGQMKIVASLMTGQKEKIMVVEVGEQQFMLGVTSHNINHLATLDKPIQNSKASEVTGQNNSSAHLNFQQKLVQAMAAGITNKKSNENKSSVSDSSMTKKDDNNEK